MKIFKFIIPILAIGAVLLVTLGIHYVASIFFVPPSRGADYITAILIIPVGAVTARLVFIGMTNLVNKFSK